MRGQASSPAQPVYNKQFRESAVLVDIGRVNERAVLVATILGAWR